MSDPASSAPAERLARLAQALSTHAPTLAERDEPFKEAAVALVLRPRGDDDGELLLIRRAVRAGDPWSGQIGLPGGRYDPSDDSLETTAIRETMEEVGLDLRVHGRRIGMLDELRPRTPVLPPIIVRPFVYLVTPDLPPLVFSEEVAEARWVALGALFVPEARVETSVTVRELRMRVQAYVHEDFTVWGMTERILDGLHRLWR